MAPAFGLFSPSASSAMEKSTEEGAAAEAKPPKGKRAARPAAAKKPPQRGLGVAQLERLRLQERWKMMTETMEPPPHSPLPIYDLPARFGGAWIDSPSLPSQPGILNPASATQAFPAMVYLPRCRTAISVGTLIRPPPFDEQFPPDLFRLASGSPFPEPPSNQTPPPCFSSKCEFCVRKRLFGENPAMSSGSVERKSMDDQYHLRAGKSARESNLKEYDFFPRSSAASAAEGESEFAGASSAAAGSPRCFIDLTLSLSS